MKLTRNITYFAFFFFFASSLYAQSMVHSVSQREAVVEKKLQKPVSFDIEEQEFSNLIAAIRKSHDIQIVVNQSAMDAGLSKDDLVTFNYSDVRLSTALELFLKQYDCTYVIKDNLLMFASVDEAEELYRVKVYPVRDILAAIQPRKTPRSPQFQGGGFGGNAPPKGGGGFGGARSGAVFRLKPGNSLFKLKTKTGSNSDAESRTSKTKAIESTGQSGHPQEKKADSDQYWIESSEEQLVNLISYAIDADSWEDNGGMATIQHIAGLLIISQSEPAHLKIDEMFSEIRRHIKKDK